jgi:anti-sigma factor RsiW
MDFCLETNSTTVLQPNRASATVAPSGGSHPPERALGRFVSNEMGPQRKKTITRHLEECDECRQTVSRLRAIARRFRDFERSALAQFQAEGKSCS